MSACSGALPAFSGISDHSGAWRVHYDVELLRTLLLAICMISGRAGLVNAHRLSGRGLRVAIGLGGLFLAMVLGGPYVPSQDFVQSHGFISATTWLTLDTVASLA